MKKLLLLTLALASFASAQYSYTFTAPAGAISCARVQPYQQWYSNLVENSTPPYPVALQPNNFFMPAFPNHPYPVANGGCPYMAGFVSADGTKAILELGSSNGWLRITSADGLTTQSLELGTALWTTPSTYPNEGDVVAFTASVPIVSVCNAICTNVSGPGNVLNFSGHFHFHWKSAVSYRWNNIFKSWTDDDAVLEGLSTVAILD